MHDRDFKVTTQEAEAKGAKGAGRGNGEKKARARKSDAIEVGGERRGLDGVADDWVRMWLSI